jgi:prevent-host-death family protein
MYIHCDVPSDTSPTQEEIPMEKKVGVTEARKEFSKIVNEVQYQGEAYLISRHGEEAAAVVPVTVYREWMKQRRAFFDAVRGVQNEADLDSRQAERLAQEAVVHARGDRG